jgi:hypothetical protein
MKKVYGLVISINYIGSKDNELRGCINDGDYISAYLKKTYPDIELNQLYEGFATRSTIQYQLENLARLSEDAIIYIYYSGHGSFLTDKSGDELDQKDECIIPIDYEENGVITDDWIYFNFLKQCHPSCFVFFIADNCNSGTICDLKYSYSLETEQVNNNRSPLDCTCISLSSSADDQLSFETVFQDKFRGIFTKKLIDYWTSFEFTKESLAFYISPDQTVTVSYSDPNFASKLDLTGVNYSDPRTWTSLPTVTFTTNLKLYFSRPQISGEFGTGTGIGTGAGIGTEIGNGTSIRRPSLYILVLIISVLLILLKSRRSS